MVPVPAAASRPLPGRSSSEWVGSSSIRTAAGRTFGLPSCRETGVPLSLQQQLGILLSGPVVATAAGGVVGVVVDEPSGAVESRPQLHGRVLDGPVAEPAGQDGEHDQGCGAGGKQSLLLADQEVVRTEEQHDRLVPEVDAVTEQAEEEQRSAGQC